MRRITYKPLEITALEPIWKALDATIDDSGEITRFSDGETHHLLMLGMYYVAGKPATALTISEVERGNAAALWAVRERERRAEAMKRHDAQAREVEAIIRLAAALTECTDDKILETVLKQVTRAES